MIVFYGQKNRENASQFVYATENYLRFVPTIAQIVLPIFSRDPVGFMQMLYVSASTTILTHTLKRGLNNQKNINGKRLGERPSSAQSKHNMPQVIHLWVQAQYFS